MRLRVLFSRKAEKFLFQLEKQNRKLLRTIRACIDKLPDVYHEDPLLKGSGFKGMRRHRVGDYRVIYQVYQSQLIIFAIEIAHCREVYDR